MRLRRFRRAGEEPNRELARRHAAENFQLRSERPVRQNRHRQAEKRKLTIRSRKIPRRQRIRRSRNSGLHRPHRRHRKRFSAHPSPRRSDPRLPCRQFRLRRLAAESPGQEQDNRSHCGPSRPGHRRPLIRLGRNRHCSFSSGDGSSRESASRNFEPTSPIIFRLVRGHSGSAHVASAAQASARARRSWRSRALRVSAAARSNSARASSMRPSFFSKSPRTLGSR